MTSRNIVVLTVAACIALGAGLWLAGQRSAGPALSSDLLYPNLQHELDDITEVRLLTPGAAANVTLKRVDGSWRVAEREDYRADATKLRRLLLAMADAKVFEAKTANPEHYATLGVQDISAGNADARQVELLGSSQPYKLIIGKRGNGRDSYFVRRADEAQSWLVDGALDADASPEQWLHREVLNISADRIQSAQVSIGQARAYTVAKESRADEHFTVTGLPRGKQLKSPATADGFATALSAINLTDVARAEQITADTKPAASSVFKTFDGLVVDAKGYRDGEDYWLTLTTSFDAEHAQRFKLPVLDDTAASDAEAKDGADTPSSGDANAATDTSADTGGATTSAAANNMDTADETSSSANKIEQESQQLNERLAGWAFQIPAFKYEALFKPVDELTE